MRRRRMRPIFGAGALVGLVSLSLVLVSGCQSVGPLSEPPPSVDRALSLGGAGDHAGEARVYEELATQNSGADRTAFLLKAVRAWLDAHRPEDAARTLAQLPAPLTPADSLEQHLLSVEIALARGQADQAAQQLAAVSPPKSGAALDRYLALKQRIAEAGSRSLTTPTAVSPGSAIALLVPLTGRQSGAASSIRDGFLTAYFVIPPDQRPMVRVYDTGAMSVSAAIARATQEGAQFIVGPLTREEVIAAADLPGPHPPVLALNFLPPEHAVPSTFYQFALSPEEEARQAARRVLADGHSRGVALVPEGDWGTRVLAAFREELTAAGGTLIESATFSPGRGDYDAPVADVLLINQSMARHKRLESVLGTRLTFDPRRRADLAFVFAASEAPSARLLRPQLKYYFAGDVATYATSAAFEPNPNANEDMDGVIFCDMPWMLGGPLADSVRAAAREAWPTGGSRRDRLFAFGFDAYRIAIALRANPTGSISMDGLTGHLSLGPQRRVHRDLEWAQLADGQPHVLAAPGG